MYHKKGNCKTLRVIQFFQSFISLINLSNLKAKSPEKEEI